MSEDQRDDDINLDGNDIPIPSNPSFVLDYYICSANLAKKFNEARMSDDKFSHTARCAFDYIALTAQNISEGRSRTIDVEKLAEYLNIKLRRAYYILAELEAHEFIIPKSKTSRWQYDIPAFPEHREYMKEVMEDKKYMKIKRMIDLLAVVMKKTNSFSKRQLDALHILFRELPSDNVLLTKELWQITGKELSIKEIERLKKEFDNIN